MGSEMCIRDSSYTEIRHPDGCTKSCKMTPKCITNQREMTMKKTRFRCRNGQKRTQSTELRTCMKTCSLLSFPCCVAQATNFQIIQSHREFIPNARREAGQFGVYSKTKEKTIPLGDNTPSVCAAASQNKLQQNQSCLTVINNLITSNGSECTASKKHCPTELIPLHSVVHRRTLA